MGLLSFVGKLLGLNATPNQKIELTKSAAAAGLPIIYGLRRVDAITVLKRVSNRAATNTGGADNIVSEGPDNRPDPLDHNNWLHRVDVWGQGPINGVKRFWIDGDAHTHKRFDSKRPYFRAASKLGANNQSAMTGLSTVTSDWTNNHKGLGVAYSWTRFFNSTKYPQYRAEPALRAEIEGLKLYDPRKDPAYGASQGHDFDDESTWEYSRNRVLVVLNYLMSPHGLGADETELDMASFVTAADVCEQQVTIPTVLTNQTGATIPNWYNRYTGLFGDIAINDIFPTYRPDQVGTTQNRYEADAVIDPKQDVVRNLETLLEEFGWSLSWSNGRHRLVIEDAVVSPVLTITEDDIIGGWALQNGSRAERLNRVTVQFTNANKDFEDDTVSWPERSSATFAAFRDADGGKELHTDKTLSTVTDFYRAKAFAEFYVRRSRVGEKITGLELGPKALLLEPGDVIAVDFADKGLSAPSDMFIVERVSVSGTLGVTVDLRRYDASVYGAETPDNEPNTPNDDSADPFADPSAITNLQGVEYHQEKLDGTVITGILVSWNGPTDGVPVEHIEVKWRRNSDGNFTGDNYEGAVQLPPEVTTCRIPDLVDNETYRVVVSYITRLKHRSIEAILSSVDLAGQPNTKLGGIEDGATRTVHSGEYSSLTTYQAGDVVQSNGTSYIYVGATPLAGEDPATSPNWALFAEAGSDGGYFDIMFRRAASQPTTPAGDSPSGWFDGPPAADGSPLWMVRGFRGADGTLSGAWSTPQEIGGSGLEIQYSADGTSGWHDPPFVQGTDLYMRQRLSGGSWSAAQRIVGEAGQAGADGQDGVNGQDGATWFTGTGAPSSGLGVVGDYYLRRDTNQIYEKVGSSTWIINFALTDNLGALADLDFVDTDQIAGRAATDSNASAASVANDLVNSVFNRDGSGSTTTPVAVTPENPAVLEKGSVDITLHDPDTDQVVVFGTYNTRTVNGRASIIVTISDGNTEQTVDFITVDNHPSYGNAIEFQSHPFMARFYKSGGAATVPNPPFTLKYTCTGTSGGAATEVHINRVKMAAILLKR